MENDEAIKYLENLTSYDYYLDNCELPLSNNIQTGDLEPDIKKDKEYYFFVSVKEIIDEYSFNILDTFNFN